jgi:hypothetical protein
MRIISFINDRKVICKILDHLGLSDGMADRKRAPPAQEKDITMHAVVLEAADDGWPG